MIKLFWNISQNSQEKTYDEAAHQSCYPVNFVKHFQIVHAFTGSKLFVETVLLTYYLEKLNGNQESHYCAKFLNIIFNIFS